MYLQFWQPGFLVRTQIQICKRFGSISASAYTLFQIMTLESWSMGVVRPTMDLFPWAWTFFLPFIIITSFAVLNFFIGIIVDSMQTAQKLEADAAMQKDDAPVTQRDLERLMIKLSEMTDTLDNMKLERAKEDAESDHSLSVRDRL